jgi:hypothetical protein
MQRIGWLTSLTTDDPEGHRRGAAFQREQLGWSDGRNVQIEYPELRKNQLCWNH